MTTDNMRDKILDTTVRQLWEGACANDDTFDQAQLLARAAYWVQVADILKDAAGQVRRSATCLCREAKERKARQSSANVIPLR